MWQRVVDVGGCRVGCRVQEMVGSRVQGTEQGTGDHREWGAGFRPGCRVQSRDAEWGAGDDAWCKVRGVRQVVGLKTRCRVQTRVQEIMKNGVQSSGRGTGFRTECKVQNRVQGAEQGAGFKVQDGVQEVINSRVHSAEQVAGCRTGVMQGGQGTVGHPAACGDGANTGSHPGQWGWRAGRGVVPTTCGSRVAPLSRDRDKGHLKAPGVAQRWCWHWRWQWGWHSSFHPSPC